MKRIATLLLLALLPVAQVACTDAAAKPTDTTKLAAERVARGQYLVKFGGCNHCHTPMVMTPHGPELDMSRMLSGHPANIVMPPSPKLQEPWGWAAAGTNTAFSGRWGVSYARNLTPDRVTGLGIWTEDMFIRTMRTGKHMGVSRPILPPMPWENLNVLTDEDLRSIFTYLRSIKPIRNEVPDPIILPPPPTATASKS